MRIQQLSLLVATAAIALLFICVPAQAASDDEWDIRISPYFFAPALDADVTASGVTQSLDLNFSDILNDFDVFGVSGRIEAWKGDWGIVLDVSYTDLEGDFGPNDSVEVDITDWIMDLQASYRIHRATLLDGPLLFDIMAGPRYHYLKQKITPDTPEPGPGTQGTSKDWIELAVGARAEWLFTEKWTLITRGDMSGFGIGSGSKLTWSVTTLLDYRFSEHWSVAGGYRYYDMDYSNGSGSSKFGFDGSLNGLMVGVSWRN
jgi:opacity protein-like surface antigen